MECLCACRIEQNMHHVHGTVRYNSIVDLETFPRHDWIRPQEHKLYNRSSSRQQPAKGSEEVCRHWFKARDVCQASIFITACSGHMLPHILPNLPCDIARPARGRILSQICFTGYYVWISCVLYEERLSLSLLAGDSWHSSKVIR
jgi:hypothetical protein